MKKGTMKKSVSILLAFLLILSLQLAPVAVFAEEESDSYIEEVVSLVNMERANEGLSELAIMEDLCYAAQVRAEELAELLDHERPDGSEWSTVLDEYEIVHSSAGENFAYGYKSPSAVMDAWMNSSGHRDNILNENFNYIGIGYYQDGASSYWVQLFISTEEEYQEDSEDTPAASEEDEEAEESPADDSAMPEQTSEVSETNPFGESGNIKSIEIAQVMGKGLSIDDGKLYPMRSLVAGKNTAILIELKEAVTIDPSGETQYVTISKDGKEVARLKPLGSAKETSLLEFLPKSIKDVNNWEAGNYTITAVIGNDKSSIDVKFQERMIMRILAVPVIGNWGGEIKSTKGEWKTAGKFTQAVYPLKNGGLVWELAPELDLSGDEYDLTTDDGMYAVWEALANKQTRDNKYTLIVGFVRDRQGDGDTQGYTYGMPATIVTESDEDMLATVAHEIAHCYEIGDEYEGGSINMKVNPAPYGMSGTDWYTEEEIVANKQFVKSDPENYGDGSIVLEEQHAYEPYDRGLLGTVVSYMGSGAAQAQYWTTSALWEQLFKSFAHNGKQVSAAGDEAEEEPEEEWINLIDVSGVVNKDGSVTLNPSYQYEGLWEDVEEPTGKGYFAVLLDKDGKELQKVEFGVSFTTRSNPPRNVDKAPFFVTMECTPETKSLEIRHGTQTIYRGEVSENKPEVSFDPIPANEELTGKHVIKWQGKDKDNDKLYYELWYVPSEEDWICLAKDITEASYEVDFDTLPGGKEAVFYLYATDGINTTFIKSQPFSAAYKEPEILTEQSEPQKYKVTDEIYFEVDVYDPQDGYMYEPEGQIVWTDKKGEVVSEDNVLFFFPYELSIGEHTFTMTATNSGGKSASKEYKLVIENDESALPQGWSREEFKEAMMYGLVDPSLMYGYTNNASKADLAATAVNLYYQLAEEIEDIEFSEEPLYSDYDDENGYAELAVSYGFLTADGDKFEPQRLVTRSEVVDTFCKVLAKAGFTINQDSKFVKDYSDIGTLSGASRTNMAYANSTGIIVGFGDNTLAPIDFSTREQLVVIAKRFADAVSE